MKRGPSTPGDSVTRRTVLRLVGGMAGVGLVGVAGASGARGTDLVRINVGYTHSSGERAIRDVADEIHHEFSFDALTITTTAASRQRLAARSDVGYVEADGTVRAIGQIGAEGPGFVPTDDGTAETSGHTGTTQQLPWGIDRVDAEIVHENGDTGRNVDVAIIDTGIDRTHVELRENLGIGGNFVGSSITGDHLSAAWQDDNGHGTHVAGIANAANNGVGVVGISTAARLHAVKVLTAAGVGFVSDVAKGLEWVADNGYEVANMSLGGPSSETLKRAVEDADEAGVTIVAAAGNGGPCEDCVTHPAAYPETIAVSATDRDDNFASFSSKGKDVDIAAPGVGILSTYTGNTYAVLDGTSMASPHVAGAVAQAIAAGGSVDTVLANTEDIGLTNDESGKGLLDVAAALGYDSSDDLGGSGGDGGADGGSDGTDPSATIESVTEKETPSPHARFDVSWSASDEDGDLDAADLELRDTTTGDVEDTEHVDVSGSSASATTTLKAHKDDGSGHDYEVTLTVVDTDGNSSSDSTTIEETETTDSSGGGPGKGNANGQDENGGRLLGGLLGF